MAQITVKGPDSKLPDLERADGTIQTGRIAKGKEYTVPTHVDGLSVRALVDGPYGAKGSVVTLSTPVAIDAIKNGLVEPE